MSDWLQMFEFDLGMKANVGAAALSPSFERFGFGHLSAGCRRD
jgi:hypothetical protein